MNFSRIFLIYDHFGPCSVVNTTCSFPKQNYSWIFTVMAKEGCQYLSSAACGAGDGLCSWAPAGMYTFQHCTALKQEFVNLAGHRPGIIHHLLEFMKIISIPWLIVYSILPDKLQ